MASLNAYRIKFRRPGESPVTRPFIDLDMAKYIDADKLKEQIEKLDMESCISEEWSGFYYGIDSVLEVIDSLQQEQPEVDKQ